MKKYLYGVAALLLAAACNSFQTATYEEEMAMPLKENSVDTLFYTLSLEYVTGGLPKEACRQINDMLLTTAFGLEEAPGTVEESAIRYRENLIDEYLTENANPELSAGLLTWGDEIKGSFAADWNKNKCYALTYSYFRGGAHGMYTITYLVFNPKTGALVTEADLFKEGYQEPVSELMRQSLRESLSGDQDALDSIWWDNVAPNGNFSPDEKGIGWIFQPYDIAPYAFGALSADVPWEQLKPYLK